jgi:hypothetical protein
MLKPGGGATGTSTWRVGTATTAATKARRQAASLNILRRGGCSETNWAMKSAPQIWAVIGFLDWRDLLTVKPIVTRLWWASFFGETATSLCPVTTT